MSESLIFVTSDRTHDYHAVHSFTATAAEPVQRKLGGAVTKILRFSDGASSQYKSKGPFVDVVHGKLQYGIDVEHHFFGSRHGKLRAKRWRVGGY